MFQLFPRIDYQIDEYDKLRAVDITISAKIKKYLRSYRALALRPYIVKNGDLPEIVANKIYGSPRYSYILIDNQYSSLTMCPCLYTKNELLTVRIR